MEQLQQQTGGGAAAERSVANKMSAEVEDHRAEVAGTPADARRRPKSGGRSVGKSELRAYADCGVWQQL